VNIVRALYGLISRGATWHVHLAINLSDTGVSSSLDEPDVWMRAARWTDGNSIMKYFF